MDIISLLITIAGILIILALYILGRVSRSKMPQEKNIASVPKIVDDNGDPFTSILDDIPATDGVTPKTTPVAITTKSPAKNEKKSSTENKSANKEEKKEPAKAQTQNILFIATKDKKGLDGNQIDKILTRHGLSYGDMDIYHYMVETESDGKASLFRTANGIDPWTLRPQDLKDKWLPGLSFMLSTPSHIDDRKAIEVFVDTSKKIADDLGGELKNKQQQAFTRKDWDDLVKNL